MRWLFVLLALGVRPAPAQNGVPQPQPILTEVRLSGASIFTRDDLGWLLRLREGEALPASPAEIAASLQKAYERDGYSEARVTSTFASGRLELAVDEGRIDDIEILGVSAESAARLRQRLGVRAGDLYNARVIGRATNRLVAESLGAFEVGPLRRDQPGYRDDETGPSAAVLSRRGTRRVLVVPLRRRTARIHTQLGSGREDFFSPADGASPAISFSSTLFDHARFNHAFVQGYVSYKFGSDQAGYSFGVERPFFAAAKLFAGAELHDISTSDDLWRLSALEQSFAALGFKNSFRDYYRRRGAQVFAAWRIGANNEISAIGRWDRHSGLPTATTYSFFRDDASYRPAIPVVDQDVNALVLGYTFDTRALTGAGQAATFDRHLKDSLFGQRARQQPGLRLDWTSEVAGHGMKGDAEFERHILNARGYIGIFSRTLLSVRGLFGTSSGNVPIEREFALGGIGSVHGYSFKETSGRSMALFNGEYRVNLQSAQRDRDVANVFVFYDAGRVEAGRWLSGVGIGAGAAGLRVEFGFRANAIPQSRQILVRFSPTF
jgi:outer membrane protein assembly factor BamA